MPNGRNPLNLVRSIPRNGATGVARNVRPVLVFNRNVVNNSIWNNNRRQISLRRGNQRVGIRVTRVSQSADFSKRFNIYVRPNNTLRPLTNYRLVVSPRLVANNGRRLGRTVTRRFRTRRNYAPREE